MKNRTLVCLLLAIGFVGFTSCGNDEQRNSNLQAENAALHAELARRANGGGAAANVVTTVVATAVANVTLTNVTSTTAATNPTVVYTVTNSNTGTAGRM